MTTIAQTHLHIREALIHSKLKIRDASSDNRRIYKIPNSLIEFEVNLFHMNPVSRQYDLISLRWCYIGPGWKWIPTMEIFDYDLPNDFRQFILFNLDLFSKDLILVDDLIEALERLEDDKKEEIDETSKICFRRKRKKGEGESRICQEASYSDRLQEAARKFWRSISNTG